MTVDEVVSYFLEGEGVDVLRESPGAGEREASTILHRLMRLTVRDHATPQ
jgi:hypothetical protein